MRRLTCCAARPRLVHTHFFVARFGIADHEQLCERNLEHTAALHHRQQEVARRRLDNGGEACIGARVDFALQREERLERVLVNAALVAVIVVVVVVVVIVGVFVVDVVTQRRVCPAGPLARRVARQRCRLGRRWAATTTPPIVAGICQCSGAHARLFSPLGVEFAAKRQQIAVGGANYQHTLEVAERRAD